MSYLDEAYFMSNPVAIPNIEQSNGVGLADNNANLERIKNCITINEPKYLKVILGRDMFLEYNSNPSDAKWAPLIAKLVDADNLRSPMANWIYIQYVTENYSRLTGVGSVKGKIDNSQNTQPFFNQIIAWNDMVFQHDIFFTWLLENREDFEQLNPLDTSMWDYLCTERSFAEGYIL